MQTTVAVTHDVGKPFELMEVSLSDELRFGEVRVKLAATGLCHTDLSVRDGYLPFAMPAVLGHEGSGVVEAVGDGVQKVAPGDHVVLTYPHCGVCDQCQSGKPTYCPKTQQWIFSGTGKRDTSLLSSDKFENLSSAFMGQSSFSNYALVTEDGVVKVDKDVPIELLGPLGCGFQTGAGAVLRSLSVPLGSSLAVFGSGSVGMAAIMAAKVSGVAEIIAVDIIQNRLKQALELGATHTVNAKEADPVEAIKEITGGRGAAYSLWANGVPEVLSQAFRCLSQTGICGVVGVAPMGSKLEIDIYELFKGKTIRGILAGDTIPDILIPQLIDLYQQGRFPLDEIVKYYEFKDINNAAKDLEEGRTIKPILKFN